MYDSIGNSEPVQWATEKMEIGKVGRNSPIDDAEVESKQTWDSRPWRENRSERCKAMDAPAA